MVVLSKTSKLVAVNLTSLCCLGNIACVLGTLMVMVMVMATVKLV